MIIGAGENQVPIITRARQQGFYTIVVSVSGDYPGFNVCDKSYEIDVRKKEDILNIAREEKICGILTDQTDMPVTTVAYVAEKLGLPGIGYNCALNFTNKYMMRQCCENIGVQIPKYYQASSLEEAWKYVFRIGFPLILKPVDCQGSRGVHRVDNRDNFKDKFINAKSYSKIGFVIIEEFCQGREIVVEGFASDSRFFNLIIGDSYDFELEGLIIPKKRIFPTCLKDSLRQKVLQINHRLVKGMGLKFGITHSEYLVNENTGEIRLVEIAARGGGVFISSDLIPLACGIDVNDLFIKIVTGEHVPHNLNRISNNASAYICFYLPKGRIHKVSGVEKVISLKGVQKACLENIKVGKQINQMSDKTMRLGPILVAGENRKKIQEIINKIQETLIIEVETPKGIKGIIW